MHVNIVTSDRGWILERLSQEIGRRLPYVSFGEGPDPTAAIQYYMTYSSRFRRLSPVEVGYFAHLEPEGEARDKFFRVAREVEHCVCHARLYEGVLRDAGIEHVTTISPGVDLEEFRPKLRIGVIGRTYHTGRKGEALVAQVMDIPEIEWSFTGEGWPGAALELPGDQLPDYYRSLDYVLVPALYEGGPMCVVEALACGTEVIAPAIGWVPEFPHVEYQVGDAADLRRVLLELVEKKRTLRASVLDRTWDAWAEGHDRVFRALAKQHGLALAPRAAGLARIARPRRVGVFMHGNEARSQGGPTVRVPRLARELRENGQDAELRIHPDPAGFENVDLVHVFNSWSPWSALDALRRARQAGKAVVFSPIFLDLTKRDLWDEALPKAFSGVAPGAAADVAIAPFRAALAARRAANLPGVEAAPGFHAAVREMASLADRMIFLSERERARLARIGVAVDAGTVVRNPVDAALFADADPALFERETGLRDFVLCVARIEPRKNQLMLVHALRDLDIPVVLIGHTPNGPYRELVERHRGPNVHVLDRMPPNSPLLASAFAAARVAVLPSWSEGAPLAALEAAASGASLVLSDESGESEYFGDRARYCDPGDPASIRAAILEAYETPRTPEEIAAQKAFVAEAYSWDRHRAATEAVYGVAMEQAGARTAAPAPAAVPAVLPVTEAPRRPVSIVFDVTTTVGHSGRWTGIARVEAALAIALRADPRADIRFVAWNNKAREFIAVPFEGLRLGKLLRFVAQYDTNPVPRLSLPPGAHFIVGGSAWMQNQVYAESVVALARRHDLRLTPIIHDIIPTRFPFWFNDGYAPVFEQNLTMLLDGAEHVVAISQATRRDVEAYGARVQGLFIPHVSVFREGDEIRQMERGDDAASIAKLQADFGNRPFVLTVGAIHQRKNHKLLYDAWLKLAERMGGRCPHLVIVGGVAWNGHEVARALRGDPRLRDKVTILENVDDNGLDWLYANCIFTVYPSLYEGWGLPVGESLRYGKLCIAADTSSVPEIAPDLVELIDPLDVAAWATKLQFYAGSRSARAAAEARIAERYRGFTWAQSAGTLLDVLAAAEARPRPKRTYTLGQVVRFSDRIAAARIRGAGWYPFEKWGCWASASQAGLVFEPSLSVDEPLVLMLEARALSFPNTPFEVSVFANGTSVAHWRIRGGDLQVLHALIPAALLAGGRPVRITLDNAFLTPVRQVTKSDDPRMVGLGIARAALAPAAAVIDVARYFDAQARPPQRFVFGRRYNLMSKAESRDILGSKWTTTSGWGMTTNELARLEMAMQELPGSDVEVELRLRPVASPAQPLVLFALANGEEVGAWTFTSDAPVAVVFPLSAELRARAAPVALDLVAAEVRSPHQLGLGASEVAFGFGLLAIEARPTDQPRSIVRLPLTDDAPLLLASNQSPAEDAALVAALGPEWHAPEYKATWSAARRAVLPLRLSTAAKGGVLLNAMVEGFQPAPGSAEVVLEIAANGEVLARHRLLPRQMRTVQVFVPLGLCGPEGELDLSFGVDVTLSPFTVRRQPDERPLGIRVARVWLTPVPLLSAMRVLRFGSDPEGGPHEAEVFMRGEWFPPEEGGSWSRGAEGRLALVPEPALGPGWRLFMLARTIGGTPENPAVVDVELDGALLDRWEFQDDSVVLAELRGVSDRIEGVASIGLRRKDPVTPRQVGLGADDRHLGVLLLAAVIIGAEEGEWRARQLFAGAGFGWHNLIRQTDRPEAPEPAPVEAVEAAPVAVVPAALPLTAPKAPPAEEPDPGALGLFDFSEDGALPGLLLSGWYEPEPDGRWSQDDGGRIVLRRQSPDASTLSVELHGRIFGTAHQGPATVEITVAGAGSAEVEFPDDDYHRRRVEIDCSSLPDYQGEAVLTLRRIGAASPAELGEGEDTRRLGVMVSTLELRWM